MQPEPIVVIPTYNEVENLPKVVEQIRSTKTGILIVDDGSPDGTGALADELAAADEAITVHHRTLKQGLGPAYADGFNVVRRRNPSVICQMDADLSHDPADLPRLIAAVENGADLAIGSRYVPGGSTQGWPLLRRIISKGGNLYVRLMLGVATKDATAGFRAYAPEALATLEPETCEATGYGFQIEMTYRAEQQGMTIEEVPICFTEREVGNSKMSGAIAIEAFRLITRWGWERMRGRLRSRS